jgi:hypothetical protein
VTVSNFQDYSQQAEAPSSRIGSLVERVSSSVTEAANLKYECERLQKDCEAQLAQMKLKCENENKSLVTRIGNVERNASLMLHESPRKFSESFSVSESPVVARLSVCKTGLERLKSLKAVEFPLGKVKAVEAIISYRTRKHGGNVHDRGIARISSKSVADEPDYALRNAADLTSDSSFYSKDEPDQWPTGVGLLGFPRNRIRRPITQSEVTG